MINSARYYVLMTEQFGRAVFAEMDLKPNTVVMYCEVLVLSEKDTPVVNSTDLQYYTFTFNDKQDCLVLGDGEIFNHSDKSNVKYELISLNNRPMMVFTTTEAVDKNEQLFIDYNADMLESIDVLNKYTTNMV